MVIINWRGDDLNIEKNNPDCWRRSIIESEMGENVASSNSPGSEYDQMDSWSLIGHL